MRVDALAIAGPNLFKPAPAVHDLVNSSAARGLDKVIIVPGRPRDYRLPPANDRLATECRDEPKAAWLARVDPLQGSDALAEAERCINKLGCVGLFLHPGEECFRLPCAIDVVRVAADAGVPVVVAAGLYGQAEPLQFLTLARTVREASIVMTSGGQINISGLSMIDAWAALSRAANLYVTTDGEYRQDYIERIASQLGPERLLFASFSPYYDQDFELSRIASAKLDASSRLAVEGGNAQRLFRL
jgi:predicted TIM-barrel fold metal-dependent hydrolase